jgi:translocation and assembly module TamB
MNRPENEEHGQPPAGKPTRRRWLRRILYGVIALPAVLIALLALIVTGPVLRLVMPRIDRAVSAAVDGRFETGRVGGSLWTGLTVDSLKFELPATGLQIDGRSLEFGWSPLMLLRGVLQIDRLSAAGLSVVLPRGGGTAEEQDEQAGEGGPSTLPLAIRLGRLDLPEFRLIDPASGRQFSYKIEASAAAGEDLSADLTLSLLPLEDGIDRLRASLAFNAGKKELAAEIDGHLDRAGIVMTLAGLRPEDAADITVSLKGGGAAERWQGDLDIAAAGLAELAGKIGVQLQGKQIGFSFSGAATTLGSMADRLPAPVQGTFEIDLAGQFDPEQNRLALAKLNLAKPEQMSLATSADLDLQTIRASADLQVDVADLSIFSALAGFPLRGAGRVAVTHVVWAPESGGRADIEVTARQLVLGQEDLHRLVGPQPVVAAQVEVSPRLDLGIRLHRFETAMAKGAGSIDIAGEFKDMNVDWQLTVQPGAIPPALGVALPQPAQLTVALAGPLNTPAGDIRLTVPGLEAGGERIENLKLATSLAWSDDAVPALHNQLDFVLRSKPYTLRADAVLPPDRLQLDLALNGAPLDLAGRLELPGYRMPMSGSIELARLDAGLFGDWGAPVAAGRVEAKIDFVPGEGGQRIDLDASVKDLRLAAIGEAEPDTLDRLAVTGHIDDALGEPVFALRLDADNIVAGQAAVDRLQATVQGALARLRATVEANGQFDKRLPVTVAASADLALGVDVRAVFDRLDVGVGTERLSLAKPLRLGRKESGELETDAALVVGAGRLDTGVRFVPGREFSAKADLRDFVLGPWAEMFGLQGMAGTLSFVASLSEAAGRAPRAEIDADLEEIRIAQAGEMESMHLQLDGRLDDGKANVHLALGRTDLQLLKADAAVPLTLSILEGRGGIDPAAPLAVHVDIDGEIAEFWPYVPLPDHSLAGRVKLAADLSGSFKEPVWGGVLHLEHGRYEHLQFGTLLQNIRIAGEFDRKGVRITEISADDGGKGRLTGNAELAMGDKETSALSYRAVMKLRTMALTRMDELQAWADVDLDVTGDDRAAKIVGEVTVNRGEVDLAVALPASVPQLEVANLAQPERQEKGEKDAPAAFAADLDVTVNIPSRFFVRGKGLDSEWGGRLEITGPAASPVLVGELRARRGQLDIIGKTFAIRDSKIAFVGGQPPEPLLGIVGVHKAGDLLVTASLSGPASSTKLTLSSNPDMPQDEILSRILFGKAQGNLSTLEALQLASAAAELSGEGGGLDVVGSFRRSLGADVLRVEGGEAGPNVEVGKYLTEGVYVGTKRGATPGSSGVEVEIELTPYLKVTSESNEVDNKAGVQFKWDY